LPRLAIEALACAAIARDLHVRQEIHLDRAGAGTLTIGASAAAGVEGESSCVITAYACFAGAGKYAPDVVPETDIGGRTGTRGTSDRRLIHFEYARQPIDALHSLRAYQRSRCLRTQLLVQIGVENIARERGFTRSGDARDDDQTAQRDADIDVAQVVQGSRFDFDCRRTVVRRASRLCRVA
jgi:hypothetical protein